MSLEIQPNGGTKIIRELPELVQILGLTDRLELTDGIDKNLLTLAFFARLQRNPSSKRADLLKHPAIPYVRTFPIMGSVVARLEASEQKHQATVNEASLRLKEFIEEYYLSPETQQRAQTIVSAVNMLVAQGLARGGNSYRKGRPVLIIDDLDSWGEFWKPRIFPPQPK